MDVSWTEAEETEVRAWGSVAARPEKSSRGTCILGPPDFWPSGERAEHVLGKEGGREGRHIMWGLVAGGPWGTRPRRRMRAGDQGRVGDRKPLGS